MPRLNLTDEEAKLIEDRRQKHAVKLMRNATLDEAKDVVDQVLSAKQNSRGLMFDDRTDTPFTAANLILAIKDELDKRRERI
jgi:hypothetical protein